MTNEKLNNLVINYRNGCEKSLETLFKEFIPVIIKQSEAIWTTVENFAEFECRCLIKIRAALKKYDPSKAQLNTLIHSIVMKERQDFVKRRSITSKNITITSMDAPVYTDKDSNEIGLEIQDVLANVEDQIIENEALNEKVALLAKGDSRRMAILKAWISGETNDLNLAKQLATAFPKVSEEGHRKFIQRFRTECQKRLATA